MTTRGMNEKDMELIVELIDEVLKNHTHAEKIKQVRYKVNEWMQKFPLYKF